MSHPSDLNSSEKESLLTWATNEFKFLDLGHTVRNKAAIHVLSYMARAKGVRVTQFTNSSMEAQKAYGFIENKKVDNVKLTYAAALAACERATEDVDSDYFVVPLDGTSVKITDRNHSKQLGTVGGSQKARGLHIQTTLLLSQNGSPLGILDQHIWARPDKTTPGEKPIHRKPEEKESFFWISGVKRVEDMVKDTDLNGKLWFQLDRGYDSAPLLEHMATSINRFTIRGEYGRSLWTEEIDGVENKSDKYVTDIVHKCDPIDTYDFYVSPSHGRAGRTARFEVKVASVNVKLSHLHKTEWKKDKNGVRKKVKESWPRELTLISVKEVSTVPDGEKPICWMLWHNRKIEDAASAREVVSNYSKRWRVEEFHKMWKTGALKVEETQMRSFESAEQILRLSAIVAIRLLRLSYLAKTDPNRDASLEFSKIEMALIQHMDPKRTATRSKPRPEASGSMAWAVAIIAELGGYTGKTSSGGPPGPLVLARGLMTLRAASQGAQAMLEMRGS